jgi:hypothetical protein
MAEITAESVLGAFPQGVILSWYARTDRVPPGWAICDGQNGTPDLRDRFLMGTGGPEGIGQRGGQAVHEARRCAKENDKGAGYYCVKADNRGRSTVVLPPYETVVFIMKL